MKEINFERLETENINQNTKNIDSASFVEIVELINNEDKTVAQAIEPQKEAIANLMQEAYKCLKNEGRLIYIGAGTSGRLGVLDASECPPTYGVDYETVIGIIAGGKSAMFKAAEGIEDVEDKAIKDLKEINLNEKDMLVGLAASGRTPYVISALKYAQKIKASTGSISCVSNAEISKYSMFPVEVITGAEVISGSTRMKAGTAQKMVLNMISTGCMIKLGKVYKNLMVDVQSNNEKLVQRAKRLIMIALNCSYEKAQELYDNCNSNVKLSIFCGLTDLNPKQAEKILNDNQGRISEALKAIGA